MRSPPQVPEIAAEIERKILENTGLVAAAISAEDRETAEAGDF